MVSATDIVGYPADMITPEQIRAARMLLGWTQQDLVAASGVQIATVKNVEIGKTDARGSTLDKLEQAFKSAGVDMIAPDAPSISGGPGVRLRRIASREEDDRGN